MLGTTVVARLQVYAAWACKNCAKVLTDELLEGAAAKSHQDGLRREVRCLGGVSLIIGCLQLGLHPDRFPAIIGLLGHFTVSKRWVHDVPPVATQLLLSSRCLLPKSSVGKMNSRHVEGEMPTWGPVRRRGEAGLDMKIPRHEQYGSAVARFVVERSSRGPKNGRGSMESHAKRSRA